MDEQRVLQRRSEVASSASPTPAYSEVSQGTVVEEKVRRTPSGGEVARRVVMFLFGIVQAFISLRILLLLADASQGNAIVRFIYDVSAVLVAPFEGILHTNAVHTGASVLDIAALVAIVGWTILELLIVAAIRVVRREP